MLVVVASLKMATTDYGGNNKCLISIRFAMFFVIPLLLHSSYNKPFVAVVYLHYVYARMEKHMLLY